MDIQVNDVSKIYGTGENKVIALSHANMKSTPETSSPLWGRQAVAKVRCFTS